MTTDRSTGFGRTPSGFGARTDVGLVRTGNEDGYLARPPLFIVADGMGGHRAGEVASALVVRLIDESLPAGAAPTPSAIAAAMETANVAVWSEARERPDLAGMGTTCTIVVLDGPRAHVAHVGDSRAYLLRDGNLEQVTSDHTLIASMVREGILSDEDAQSDERRHIITRAIGAEQEVRIDLASHDLRPGDRLLLCSDGLSGQVDDVVIEQVLATEADPSRAVNRLVELANEAGGEDNVTVIVVDPDRLGGPDVADAANAATVIGAAPTTSPTSAPTVIAAPTTVAELSPPPVVDRGGAGTSPAASPVASATATPSPVRTRSRDGGPWRAVAAVLAFVLVVLLALAATGALGTSPTPSDVPPASAAPGGSIVPGVVGSGTLAPLASPVASSGVQQATPAP